MSAATKAAIAELCAEGLQNREIAARLGISACTVGRYAVYPERACIICGESFRGRLSRLTCSDACIRVRGVEMKRLRALRRRGQPVPPGVEETSRPEPERERGVTVEEWLAERRPRWTREPSPRPDPWAGYSADAAEVSA